ncbi:hypothetical protein ARMGADRAFT_1029977 [Armillaria gallica]|uniref:Uncharacterized protein n=1 Tax=Armillaria gallica TaxID=47427 RepID=A0A2H3DJA8_ARMGA|nr:hypothetical protein ARMGADRAFT_1029977 [Armillaria gallica]
MLKGVLSTGPRFELLSELEDTEMRCSHGRILVCNPGTRNLLKYLPVKVQILPDRYYYPWRYTAVNLLSSVLYVTADNNVTVNQTGIPGAILHCTEHMIPRAGIDIVDLSLCVSLRKETKTAPSSLKVTVALMRSNCGVKSMLRYERMVNSTPFSPLMSINADPKSAVTHEILLRLRRMLYGDILDEISFKELESSWSVLFCLFLSELGVEATTVTDGVESLSNTNKASPEG